MIVGSRHPPVTLAAVNRAGALDDLDAAIFELLQGDGRLPYRTIARELDVPEGTVRFRVNRLVREGIVHITATIHPQLLGGVLATLLVRVEAAHQQRVVAALTALDAVMYISELTGRAQLMLQAIVADLDALHRLAGEQIGTVEGVIEVETMLELEIHKAQYRFSELRKAE